MIRSKLRPEEQAEVWRRYRTGESMWSISRTLGRSLKAVWRLISARGGRAPKLTHCRRLRRLVKDKLALCWSPQQIARWLPGARPRWPRAVPVHWEGDLLLGRRNSGIATLVERTTRFAVGVDSRLAQRLGRNGASSGYRVEEGDAGDEIRCELCARAQKSSLQLVARNHAARRLNWSKDAAPGSSPSWETAKRSGRFWPTLPISPYGPENLLTHQNQAINS